jgi:phosphopantetheinyl transferase (holo-ACP synthase)
MTDQARFTIASLLEGKSAIVQITPVAADKSAGIAGLGFRDQKGLGLEIDNIAALPDAEDYALHEFYRATFTPSEIAYCIKQPAVKAAFQGLLAVKRAIVKSGAASDSPDGPRSVEIGFDSEGRPTYPGCLLSISDTGTIAAAVCFWMGGLNWPPPGASGAEAARPPMRTFPVRTRILAFLVLLSLLLFIGALVSSNCGCTKFFITPVARVILPAPRQDRQQA